MTRGDAAAEVATAQKFDRSEETVAIRSMGDSAEHVFVTRRWQSRGWRRTSTGTGASRTAASTAYVRDIRNANWAHPGGDGVRRRRQANWQTEPSPRDRRGR